MADLTLTKVKSIKSPAEKLKIGSLTVFLNSVLILFSLSCIFPLVWMFYSSLKVKRVFNADIMGLPKDPTISNYVKVITNPDYHIGESMLNSVRTTALSLFFIVLFGFVVGYILARLTSCTDLRGIQYSRTWKSMVHLDYSVCSFWIANLGILSGRVY